MKLILLLFLTTISLSLTTAYNVLCVIHLPFHSHNQVGRGIVNALLEDGNNVTWVTPYPEKVGKILPKELKIIDASSLQPFGRFSQKIHSHQPDSSFMKQLTYNISRDLLTLPAVMDAIVKTQYDAVITEIFLYDILAGIAAVQQVPWILLSSIQMIPMTEEQVDAVRSVGNVPLLINDTPMPMSFVRRVYNVLLYMYTSVMEILATLPPFDAAFYNVSVMLVNAHESVTPPFSVPPNVISIAGYHMDEEIPPLPKDLQSILDNSTQGVIYFSMGSILKSTTLKEHLRAGLLRVFASLPYTVLWKFEETLPGLPSNVHVRPWFPQPSVLAHPNTRLFITHGGHLSCLEAIRAGVPLLILPIYGDQPGNAERAVRNGYGVRLMYSEDQLADDMRAGIEDILNNDTYTKQAKYLSKLFAARPVSPKKLIQHYVKLAIETKGAYHLRSLALQQGWYELWMLDVAAFLLVMLATLIVVIVYVIKTCVITVTGRSKCDGSGKKKRN